MLVRAARDLLQRADVLVPVPLHRGRLFHRKYNQAAVLAFAVGRLADKPVLPDGLERIRPNRPLDDRSPEERAREIAGSLRSGRLARRAVCRPERAAGG